MSAARAGLPRALDAPLARGLAVVPADRFESCRALVTALRVASRPPAPRPASFPESSAPPAAAIAVAVLAVIAAGAVLLVATDDDEDAVRSAVRDYAASTEDDRRPARLGVDEVKAGGDAATARVRHDPSGDPFELRLMREDGAWRVTGARGFDWKTEPKVTVATTVTRFGRREGAPCGLLDTEIAEQCPSLLPRSRSTTTSGTSTCKAPKRRSTHGSGPTMATRTATACGASVTGGGSPPSSDARSSPAPTEGMSKEALRGHAPPMKYMHHRSRAGDARLLSAAFRPAKKKASSRSARRKRPTTQTAAPSPG